MLITVLPEGVLIAGGRRFRCALGRGGVSADKHEGDGATPIGRFPLRRCLFRPDRMDPPHTGLPAVAIGPHDGWCDDLRSPYYNRQVLLPFAGSHEELWREDGLYDLVLVIGHNDDPPAAGAGSAIFLHVARPDFGPTEGCVALARPDVAWLLARCGPATAIDIRGAR